MFEKEITFDRFIRGLMVVAGLGLAIYIINLLSAVLLPFFIAWFLAYMIYPTVKFFQYKLHLHNRILCIAITLLLILAAIAGFFWLIIPPAIAEFVRFRDLIADFIKETGNSTIARNIEIFFQQNIDQNAFIRLLHENNVMGSVESGRQPTMEPGFANIRHHHCTTRFLHGAPLSFFHLVGLRKII